MEKYIICNCRNCGKGSRSLKALAYKLVRQMNDELNEKGYLLLPGLAR